MKRMFFAAVAALAVVACGPKTQVSGHLDGVTDLLISFASDEGTGLEFMKEIKTDNGDFAFDVAEERGLLLISDKSNFITYKNILYVPGEQLVLKGSMTDYTISGSQFYREMGEFHELTKELEAREYEALVAMVKAEEEGTRPIISYDRVKSENEIERGDIALEYIKAHPDSDFSAYLVSTLRTAVFDRGESLLTERAKSGKLGAMVDKKHLQIHGAEIAKHAREYIKEGVEAPDFTLKTVEGEDWTLSEHRGGYVLLDFWGTWCHFCVEGMPEVRKVSDTYADRLTVVSVDCADSETEWKLGLEKLTVMNWTQVYNPLDVAVDAQYAVDGYPSFYLIDPQGIIKKIFVGESRNFVEEVGKYLD